MRRFGLALLRAWSDFASSRRSVGPYPALWFFLAHSILTMTSTTGKPLKEGFGLTAAGEIALPVATGWEPNICCC